LGGFGEFEAEDHGGDATDLGGVIAGLEKARKFLDGQDLCVVDQVGEGGGHGRLLTVSGDCAVLIGFCQGDCGFERRSD
jgi:hypothetical protein